MSGIKPADRFIWILEISWIPAGIIVLFATNKRFPLTPLLYRLLFIHALILIVGGYYTYEKVPAGLWAKDFFDFSRNHYDRIGHFAQGFVPAILAREILIRKSPVNHGRWLFLFVTCICLSFSAFFEMIEWWVSVSTGEKANAFLGTQGDIWDTQWDMFMCLVGAISSQIVLCRVHDREIRKM